METAQDTVNDILIVSDAEAGGLDPALLEGTVKQALARLSSRYADVFRFEAINTNMIDMMHALLGPSQWKEAIRALCHAKVAFMDISNYSPGTMMLLGVRSVVRRGVTITLRTHEGSLPWNIREIKPVELHKLRFRQEAYNLFSSVLRDAWQRFCTEPAYSDLPVYDAIRSLSTADHSRIPPTQQILVLCSFSDRHKNQNWPLIERTLQLASAELESFKGTMLEPVSVIRTLDMHSTTLVGHALYNAIRRSAFCIIDWTDWRPSVFFEFGVASLRRILDPSA